MFFIASICFDDILPHPTSANLNFFISHSLKKYALR